MKATTPRRYVVSTVAILLVVFTSLVASAAERQLVRTARANYPEMAKRMHVSGTVRLGVHIAPDGSVTKVDVIGGNSLLTQAAVESVKQWKYQAGAEETRAVNVDFNMQ